MKTLFEWISKGTRSQSVGLLTIGGSMLICSALAEAGIADSIARELAQVLVIVAGLAATVALFRRREAPAMKGRWMSNDLKLITNAFRGGRLIVVLLFSLFMLVMVLGFIAQAFRPDSAAGPRPDSHFRRAR